MVDITDFRALEERVRGCEYVINLAAVTSNVEFERDPPYRCYSVNVNGFLNVLEASRRNSVRKVVYASSAAVYLDSFSENVVIDHNRQRNHYAKSKLMNEMHAASYSDIYGLRCVGLRLFNVFGPDENQKGDYASIISRFLRDHEEGGKDLIVYGDGTQARDFIHVDDASRIIMDILERGGEESVYNVGTGRSHRYIDIARAIDRERIRFVPNPPLRSYQMLTRLMSPGSGPSRTSLGSPIPSST